MGEDASPEPVDMRAVTIATSEPSATSRTPRNSVLTVTLRVPAPGWPGHRLVFGTDVPPAEDTARVTLGLRNLQGVGNGSIRA